MQVKDFDYMLPEELIAQDPIEDRSASRLMILNPENGEVEHKVFSDIIDELEAGDCLVINDTKVIPARLIGSKEGTDARIELLLDANHRIGHSFFLGARNANDIANIIRERIIPLLEEYFFDDTQKIQLLFNDLDENGDLRSTAIYQHKNLNVDAFFSYVGEYLVEDRKCFDVAKTISVDSLKQIYSGITL